MQVIFQDFQTEYVSKGKQGYEKGTVTYTVNGQNRTQSMVSFTNPAVFKLLKEVSSGTVLEVEITKNAAGYNQWASASRVEAGAAPAATASPAVRVSGSNYETADERKLKQMFIVKQSSISSAIALLTAGLKPGAEAPGVGQVLDVAQEFVDFVYGVNDIIGDDNPEVGA